MDIRAERDGLRKGDVNTDGDGGGVLGGARAVPVGAGPVRGVPPGALLRLPADR
ncbi:hypothetical protein GCM10017688_61600 [Streptomyces ramulosus]